MNDRDTFAAAALTGLLANGSGLIAANGLNQFKFALPARHPTADTLRSLLERLK